MSETYIKAEIVRPRWTTEDWTRNIIQALLSLALLTLIVWWFLAAWFPNLGLTYWQLVLPVFVIRMLFGKSPNGRQLNK